MSVRFEGVAKDFNGVVALADFSLDVADGEFMVLLGPSGCGKSTALRILAGLEEPTAGDVYIDERNVTELQAHQRDIAMVFQSYALYPHMSVYDNIAFGLRVRHIPRADVDRSVREAADLLGLTDLLKRRPGQLSGGQRQRVALGRAIVRRPKAFLMDEPLSNLDAKLRSQTRIELIRLHRRLQTTVLFVTHDQVEAMTMGERIAILDRGLLQQVGTPGDVYTRPSNIFVAEFIGSPPTSFFKGPVRASPEGALIIEAPAVTFTLTATQAASIHRSRLEEVTIGIRPEHIDLAEHPDGVDSLADREGHEGCPDEQEYKDLCELLNEKCQPGRPPCLRQPVLAEHTESAGGCIAVQAGRLTGREVEEGLARWKRMPRPIIGREPRRVDCHGISRRAAGEISRTSTMSQDTRLREPQPLASEKAPSLPHVSQLSNL